MKLILASCTLLLAVVISCPVATAQPDSLWSYRYGGLGGQFPAGIATLPNGRIIWAGTNWHIDGRTEANPCDIVMGCLSVEGDVLWERQFELPGKEQANDIAVNDGWYIGVVGSVNDRGILIFCDDFGRDIFVRYVEYPDSEVRLGRIYSDGEEGFAAVGLARMPGENEGELTAPSPFIYQIDSWIRDSFLGFYPGEYGQWQLDACRKSDGGWYIAQTVMRDGVAGRDSGIRLTEVNGDYQQISERYYYSDYADEEVPAIVDTPTGLGLLVSTNNRNRAHTLEDDNELLIINDSLDVTGVLKLERWDYQFPRDLWWMGDGFLLGTGDYFAFNWHGANALAMDAYHLIRTDDDGSIQWEAVYNSSDFEMINRVTPTMDGGYAMTGWVITEAEFAAGYVGDVLIVKTGPDPLSIPASRSFFPPSSFILHPAFPHPFNSSTTITYDVARPGFVRLDLFDLNGRLVETVLDGFVLPGSYRATLNGEGLSSGNYFVKLRGGEFSTPIPITYVK